MGNHKFAGDLLGGVGEAAGGWGGNPVEGTRTTTSCSGAQASQRGSG